MRKILLFLTLCIFTFTIATIQPVTASTNYHMASIFWDTPDPHPGQEFRVFYSADSPIKPENWELGDVHLIPFPSKNEIKAATFDPSLEWLLFLPEIDQARFRFQRIGPPPTYEVYTFNSAIRFYDDREVLAAVKLLYDIYDFTNIDEDVPSGWSDPFTLDFQVSYFQVVLVTEELFEENLFPDALYLYQNIFFGNEIPLPPERPLHEGMDMIIAVLSAVGAALFSIQVLPGISIGIIIAIPVVVSLFWFIIRFIRG